MLERLRGIKSVVHDAVDLTLDLVEEGHESTARTVLRALELVPALRRPAHWVDDVRRASTCVVLGSARAVNGAVRHLTDAGLDAAVAASLVPWLEAPAGPPLPMRSDLKGTAAWLSDAAIGGLNGAVGDYLHRERNGLDLGFSLRIGDTYVSAEGAGPLEPAPEARRLAVLVHGLGATEWSWCWDAAAYHGDASANFGTLLERDLGFSPVFARYNTGRHVFENGRLLSIALHRLVPAGDSGAQDILLLGHSMGGLVIRAACMHASENGHAWVRRVSRVLCLGTPHQGAPLEKLGHVLTTVLGHIDHPGTRIPAAILKRRSAGIRDLRHGTVVDASWLSPDPDAGRAPRDREVPLLEGVSYYFLSATVTRDPAHPLSQLVGDILVRVPSASGTGAADEAHRVRTQCFGGVVHHQLQNHPDVYALVRRICGEP